MRTIKKYQDGGKTKEERKIKRIDKRIVREGKKEERKIKRIDKRIVRDTKKDARKVLTHKEYREAIKEGRAKKKSASKKNGKVLKYKDYKDRVPEGTTPMSRRDYTLSQKQIKGTLTDKQKKKIEKRRKFEEDKKKNQPITLEQRDLTKIKQTPIEGEIKAAKVLDDKQQKLKDARYKAAKKEEEKGLKTKRDIRRYARITRRRGEADDDIKIDKRGMSLRKQKRLEGAAKRQEGKTARQEKFSKEGPPKRGLDWLKLIGAGLFPRAGTAVAGVRQRRGPYKRGQEPEYDKDGNLVKAGVKKDIMFAGDRALGKYLPDYLKFWKKEGEGDDKMPKYLSELTLEQEAAFDGWVERNSDDVGHLPRDEQYKKFKDYLGID